MSMSLTDLLQLPPDEVFDWLRNGGYADAADTFNWLGLIEVAGQQAANGESRTPHERRAWTDVALAALARAEVIAGLTHHEVVLRRLNLTAVLIRRLGPGSSELVVDSAGVARLFLAEVPFQPSEVLALTSRQGLSITLLRALRTVKNWLSPVAMVAPHLTDPALRSVVEEWTSLRSRLP